MAVHTPKPPSVNVDLTSQIAPRASNFYDSVYLAEYYDIWADENKDTLDTQGDAAIYWQALQTCYKLRQPPVSTHDHFTVLDVGTGTGRCLHNLTLDGKRADFDLGNVSFIGLDNTQAMLDRASHVGDMSNVGSVSWVNGSALDLESVMGDTKVDLLLFAVGSICHLHNSGETERFMEQVARVLRRGTGQAMIPLQNELIISRCHTKEPMDISDAPWSKLDVAQDYRSRNFPGIVYRQSPVQSSVLDGNVRHDKYTFQVLQKSDDKTPELVVEDNEINWTLRLWKEEEWLSVIKHAGLNLVETFQTTHETYYVIRLLKI